VLRTRAVSTDPSSGAKRTLTTFDAATFEQCLGDGLSAGSAWITIGQDCQGVNNSVASLVSTSLSPLDLSPKPPWLSLKGDVDPVTETQNQYYAKWGAPATLAAFKTQFGFTSSDPTATYYNDGDLAIGREMHCHRNTGTGEVACFVNNYSKTPGVAAFGDDPDLTLTNANGGLANAFATVAMVYTPPAAGASATNSVKFVVYGSDANHSRVNTAKLDTVGAHVSVPNNCLTCHGIDANYSPAGHTVDGNARFLPFDPYSYRYSSTIAGLTLAAQQEAFRKLNAIVAATPQTAAEQDFMTGLYAPWTVTTPGAFANDSYVPTGWQSSGNLSLQSSYLGIVKVGCRTCHMSAVVSTLDFLQATDWPQAQVNNIRTILCKPVAQGGTHVMPQAERTTQKLWQSGARGLLITGWPYAKLNAADPAHDNLEACVP
jgi:hypothetical protein